MSDEPVQATGIAEFVERYYTQLAAPLPADGLAEAARFHRWLESRMAELRLVQLSFVEPTFPADGRAWIASGGRSPRADSSPG